MASEKLLHVNELGTEVFKGGCVEQCGSCRGLTRLPQGNVVNIFHPLADYENGAWDGEQEGVVN